MIEITELAAQKLSAYLTDNKISSAVRISLMNSCGGASLGLALDEQKSGDISHEDDAFTLVIDQGLSQTCGIVKVDYQDNDSGCGCGSGGFSLSSEKPLPGARGGCGGSCSSGSCGC